MCVKVAYSPNAFYEVLPTAIYSCKFKGLQGVKKKRRETDNRGISRIHANTLKDNDNFFFLLFLFINYPLGSDSLLLTVQHTHTYVTQFLVQAPLH